MIDISDSWTAPAACVFPFTYAGETYSSCVHDVAVPGQHDGSIPWCCPNSDGHYGGGSAWLFCAIGTLRLLLINY